jgi:DNA-directed RNA polymerase subunit RPC12/RpoP
VVSGVFRNYVQCQYCRAKWKLSVYQGRVGGLMLHELPKNGQALWRVPSLKAPLYAILGLEYGADFWSGLGLVSGVDWEYLNRCVPADVASAAIMGKGERSLAWWLGFRVVSQPTLVGGQTIYSAVDVGGAMLLTSRRLLWLEQHVTTRRSGFLSTTTESSWLVKSEIPLDGIKGITGSSGDSQSWPSFTEVHVVDAAGEHVFKLQYGFWEVFKPVVEAAVGLRQDEAEREKRQDKVQVLLDFSFLRKYMEDGGMVVQNLKCPECGASVKFPDAGSQSVCDHCGANIYANDVFKKIKDLIG